MHIRPKYACKTCEGVDDPGPTVSMAPVLPQILPKSRVSSGLLAHILTSKFVDALPFYRQEKQFARLSVELSRTSMSQWAIHTAKVCEPLLALLKNSTLLGPLIQMDETTLQVLKEAGRAPSTKSYIWVMRGGTRACPVVFFHYSETRSAGIARDLLQGYRGVVQTDGYAGYDFLDLEQAIIHAGCWAHSRRKFHDVLKAMGQKNSINGKPSNAQTA
ncbi:MAG: IS66 family transposase, partial [SAR324 cluster bacterium]|nr:IS66 family transposase [SAR324 cluster bacterium]